MTNKNSIQHIYQNIFYYVCKKEFQKTEKKIRIKILNISFLIFGGNDSFNIF